MKVALTNYIVQLWRSGVGTAASAESNSYLRSPPLIYAANTSIDTWDSLNNKGSVIKCVDDLLKSTQ